MSAEIAAARALLEAAGYVVLKTPSYFRGQERIRVARAQQDAAVEARESARAWARDSLTEERRLRERLTFVYGVAMAHGATTAELAGSTGERSDS